MLRAGLCLAFLISCGTDPVVCGTGTHDVDSTCLPDHPNADLCGAECSPMTTGAVCTDAEHTQCMTDCYSHTDDKSRDCAGCLLEQSLGYGYCTPSSGCQCFNQWAPDSAPPCQSQCG